MGKKLIILTTLFSLAFLYGIYYFGIPAFINIKKHTDVIEKTVLNETGYKINISSPDLKMGYLPSIWIKADNIAILNNDNSKALNIDKLKLNIKLLPLILKKIDIKYFSADNIYANLVLTKNSKLQLGQYPLVYENIKSPFTLSHASAHTGNYNIKFTDELQNKQIILNGKFLNVKDFTSDKNFDLSTIAYLQTDKNKTFINSDISIKLPISKLSNDKLQISGDIKNLNLADFSGYAKLLSKGKIKSTEGVINLTSKTTENADKHKLINTSITINKLKVLTDEKASSIICNDKLKIISSLNTLNNGIEINELKILSNGINMLFSGNITDINNKIPHVDLKAVINKSKAENIISLLPGLHDLTPDIDLYILKKTGFWADVSGNLEFKGKADYPNVYGNVLVSNAYMVKPIPNAEKAVIKLSYTGNKMNLDVEVPTSPTQTVYVKGPIILNKERTADLYIKSTDNVDLKTAQIVLNPLHEMLHFDLGPVPIMDIQGKGGIDFHVTGTRKNPHGWGQFRFKNATVKFLDIHNMTLTNGSGTLDFDNQNTLFRTKSAYLNGRPISVQGTCSLLGVLNFDIKSSNQELSKLLQIIKTSPMLTDLQKLISPLENGSGPVNLNIKLTGQVKDPKDIVFNKNLFAGGEIKLLSNTVKIKDIPAKMSNTKGTINFNNLDADFNLSSNIYNSKINIKGELQDTLCDLRLQSDKFHIADGLKILPDNIKIPYEKDLSTITSSFTAKYKGAIDNIELKNLTLNGLIYSNKTAKSLIKIDNNAPFKLNNSSFKLPLIKGTFKNSPYNISLNIDNMFDKSRTVSGNCKINSLDLNLINDNALQYILPAETAKILKDIDFLNGKINLTARIKNNNINAYSALNDVSLVYKPKHMKITVNSGNLLLRNNILNLNKINAQAGKMPLFIDGQITNVYKNPNVNLYINAKPTQEFFDQFFNNNSLYPIKLKGDIILTARARGTADYLNTKASLDIAEDSSLYYMGATIGDAENPVKINIDNTLSGHKLKINNLTYDKIITSQNNKPFVTPQLTASGTIDVSDVNNAGFNNFKIKTLAPTDAKIFNIIFGKPFMKQGVFTSDLLLNGTSLNPKIKGKLAITSIDIPFFDSTIKDINLDFNNDKIFITGKGTVLTNDVRVEAEIKNSLTVPYIINNLKIKLADLNVNKIMDTIRDIEAESTRTHSNTLGTTIIQPFDISQVIIKKAEIIADKIKVRNINADNFTTDLSLNKNGVLDINNFKFNIAEGTVVGRFTHNINNHKTNLDINLNNANALIMSEALFDLKGQVYGSVNGNFNLACSGDSQEECFKTISGAGNFKIADGKMPKLGSLEYLLKAGNLLKGGFTGLSINSLIDLVTPLKTGSFDSISGDIEISEGIADKINIYSSGHDLNMYMTGSYNLSTSIAEMKIYGSLTKNITTVFGKIKNASLNRLFNTIPAINNATEKLLLQEDISKIPNIKDATDIYRIFFVDVNGDINGSDYIRSFKWVK